MERGGASAGTQWRKLIIEHQDAHEGSLNSLDDGNNGLGGEGLEPRSPLGRRNSAGSDNAERQMQRMERTCTSIRDDCVTRRPRAASRTERRETRGGRREVGGE